MLRVEIKKAYQFGRTEQIEVLPNPRGTAKTRRVRHVEVLMRGVEIYLSVRFLTAHRRSALPAREKAARIRYIVIISLE